MAKKKKKSNAQRIAGEMPANAGNAMQDIDAKEKACAPPRSVSAFTALAGMFLTLILGIYIGTLLPGISSGDHAPRETAALPAPASPPPAMPVPAARPPETSGIPAEIAARIEHLEKDLTAAPGNAQAWIELGNLYFDVNNPPKAIAAYEKALDLQPDNADVLTDLGIMYRETEDFTRAVQCFRKAAALNPGHENALYNEGIVLSTDLHNKEEAIAAWEKLLRINPQAHAPDGTPLADMIRKLR